MKSMFAGTGCPADVAATVAWVFAVIRNRTYAAPPPTTESDTGFPPNSVDVEIGNVVVRASAETRLRKFQLGFVYLAGRPPSRSSTNCATAQSRVLVMMSPKTELKFRSEEHTSELQSHHDLVCRLLLEKKK